MSEYAFSIGCSEKESKTLFLSPDKKRRVRLYEVIRKDPLTILVDDSERGKIGLSEEKE
jgi:hypothetical protein